MSSRTDKIASMLGDISKKHHTEPTDEFMLDSKNQRALSPIDNKTIELLELIDEYEKLANENRLNYINGFLNLSRANYNNGTLGKKFGVESFDMRPYQSCKRVSIGDEIEIVDILQEGIEKKATEVLEKPSNASDTIESTFKNRKTKEKRTNDSATGIDDIETQKSLIKDPIHQFGGLVPYQLKQSQKDFNDSIFVSVRIINLQKRIEILIKEIEETSK